MKAAPPPADLVVTAPGDGPVVLAGPPGRVRGRLSVRNAGVERARLRGFVVRAHDLPAEPGAGQLAARLAPGCDADVAASLALPPDTPPGVYHATLDVGGREIDATVHVVDDPSLELSPSRILVEAGTTRWRLVVRNTGNVRVDIAPVARARLRSDPDLDALPGRNSGDAHRDDRDTSYDAVLRVAGQTGVDPGEVVVLDAEVDVPEEIDAQRRHLALLPVATATLRVVVAPRTAAPAATSSGPAVEPAPTTPRRRAPRRSDA